MNFINAIAYHICPSLPAAFTQPAASTLADLCTAHIQIKIIKMAPAKSSILAKSEVGRIRKEARDEAIK